MRVCPMHRSWRLPEAAADYLMNSNHLFVITSHLKDPRPFALRAESKGATHPTLTLPNQRMKNLPGGMAFLVSEEP